MEEILSLQELKSILPIETHRLMLDRVIKLDDSHFIGWKNATIGEAYFPGHFPGQPIVPGVLLIESVSQLAEVAVWEKLDPQRNKDIYIKTLDRVKFRKPNVPGDRLKIDLQVKSCTTEEALFSALIYNKLGVACQMDMTLAARERVTKWSAPLDFNEYDRTDQIFLDASQIMHIIPHRYPFLMVDYVLDLKENQITAVKNLTASENIYRHYPDGYTVLSNAFQPEILSQPGAISILMNEKFKGKIAMFMGIDHCDFYTPVFPGDQLVVDLEIPSFNKRFGKGTGKLCVNGQIACELSMMFAITDPQ